jgi:catechol 2,3-dioxygenase-like lactoylglutathione lyase family enzyme
LAKYRKRACVAQRHSLHMSTKAIAFLATAKPADALAFYRDVLGLALLEDTPFAIVFDAFGTMLRIQKVQLVVDAPYTAFGLDVHSIETEIDRLLNLDVSFIRFPHLPQDAMAVWTAPSGAKIAWFHDPDGNLLSLTQLA